MNDVKPKASSLSKLFWVDLEIAYDYYTDIISTEGMQICGLTAKPLPLDKRPVSFDSIEFVPLTSGSYKVSSAILNVETSNF